MKLFRPSVMSLMLALGSSVPLFAADPVLAKSGYSVQVEVDVKEDGTVESARYISSDEPSAGQVLSKLAIKMALVAKLPPRLKDGKAMKYKARMPFFYPVEGDEGAAANAAPKPRVKNAGKPVYPESLAQANVAGGTIFEFVIDATGKLTRLTLLRASNPEFATSAEEAIKKWEFIAAEKDGHPVESRWKIACVFETENAAADWPWLVAPRPSFGSFIVVRPNPVPAAATPAEGAPAVAPKLQVEPTVPAPLAPSK